MLLLLLVVLNGGSVRLLEPFRVCIGSEACPLTLLFEAILLLLFGFGGVSSCSSRGIFAASLNKKVEMSLLISAVNFR